MKDIIKAKLMHAEMHHLHAQRVIWKYYTTTYFPKAEID